MADMGHHAGPTLHNLTQKLISCIPGALSLPPRSRPKPLAQDRWRARKVRFFRNGDRYYPGYEFVFKPGRDVVNMEALCDKISDRIGKDGWKGGMILLLRAWKGGWGELNTVVT